MKRKSLIVFLFVICMCIVLCTPMLVFADSTILPPTDIKVSLLRLGWPGEIPNSIELQWQSSETDEVASYNIYEVITEEDGITEYVKVGSSTRTTCYLEGLWFGYHSFTITSVMSDGRESDYSEIAIGGMFYQLLVRKIDTTDSSISIEWDAPSIQDADGYEILYRTDDYEYWKYFDDFYNEKEIHYDIIRNIDEKTRSYTINGLLPDTKYVIMVLAYYNGEILDNSKFNQMKTRKEDASKQTTATIYFKDSHTNKTIKTEVVPNLKTGTLYTYEPKDTYTLDDNMVYLYDRSNTKNLLTIEALRVHPDENIITVYYTNKSNKVNLSEASAVVKKTVYSGKKQTPKTTVKYNGKTLSLNKDFTVSYRNSKNVGKATAIITGIGNYTGMKRVSFTVLPKATKIKKLTFKKTGEIVVKIDKSKGAKGYEVSYATNKKFTSGRKKKTTGPSVTLKSIENNNTYYVRVRAYAKIGKKTIYSSYSPAVKIIR